MFSKSVQLDSNSHLRLSDIIMIIFDFRNVQDQYVELDYSYILDLELYSKIRF